MGRKKLNKTKEQIREQNRIRSKRYYDNHKAEICEKRMKRYDKKKLDA